MTPQFCAERKIRLKAVMGLDCWLERPSYRTVCRWANHGLGGVRLESCRQGNLMFTTREACVRFLDSMNGDRP